MSRTCTICTHASKEDIDKALLAGTPYRSVAKQYEASPPSVYRHQHNHLPAAMVKAVEAAEVAHGDSLLEQLKGLQVKALGILTKAEQAGDLRLRLYDGRAGGDAEGSSRNIDLVPIHPRGDRHYPE